MKHNYTIHEVKVAVKQSSSVAQALKKLGVSPRGGNYQVLYRLIEKYKINCDHFTGQGHNKGERRPKRPLAFYTQFGFPINSFRLKTRLLQEGVFEPICNSCKGRVWMGKPMPLELEHKNGNNEDNRLENLELLCPNCHSFTPTYRGRNQKRKNK